MEKGQETTAGEAGMLAGCVWWKERQGECGRQKPHGSLSRAEWQGASASKAEVEEKEGSRRQWNFLGCSLSEEPLLLTFTCRL